MLVGGCIFFFRLVEEEEGEDIDGCCAPDVQEFICQEMSVFLMGSSRKVSLHDEARCQGE